MRSTLIILAAVTALGGTVVIDRIAVVVGKQVIKSSDVERDLRLTEFLNREPLGLSVAARRKAANRLIDQQLIRIEIASGGYSRAPDSDAEALFRQIERERFAGSATRMKAELTKYGVTESELRQQLLWQITVLRFIQERFQPGVSVSDQDIRTYYDQHLADLERQNAGHSDFDQLAPKIRSLLEGQAVDRAFDDWLGRARERTHVEYREGAFQ